MEKLAKILRSPIKKKIISFFRENPRSIDTTEGISTWTNLNPRKVRKALEELVKNGILVVHHSPSTTGYAYTQNEQIISEIEGYFASQKNGK